MPDHQRQHQNHQEKPVSTPNSPLPIHHSPPFWSSLAEHWHIARTLRHLAIHFHPERCVGDLHCYEVCPVGCWLPGLEGGQVALVDGESCIACGACVLQCPENAIELR
jgi:NAD-dependent dihydropyrimidine dehydrogenase PreA subunit